ncbi:flagellar biosynthetic protein FliR [Caldisalinibacter kiritimatiensis]|uniref:Flagellar biosynthetic protein FliR n=1 Tax=Caldisalinibacter kiritimatiensis TaxID=1304284 RepID=R1AST2_9FIRM|nr:flagellar biosynthetic protein FliR [Caldisalinibacter kiritimatiensis]EOC99721.1 Flagellar biosynthesis protein FliR [Caldisalinibacter kiritimatiensis]
MEGIYQEILNKYQVYLLVFVRVAGIFIISPIFSRRNIPKLLKIGFTFLLSVIVFNLIEIDTVNYNDSQLIFLIIKEALVGGIIGFVAYLFFTVLYLSGQIIDMQIGFGMVNVLDPQHNIQIPITGNFLYIVAILVFLLTNGHLVLIEALISSFKVLPIGNFTLSSVISAHIVRILSEVFIIAFKVSSPLLATIFITNIMLGILARTVPQMNVFVVGMPLKIIIGLATMIITMPIYILALQHIFDNMYEEIFNLIKAI